jgi:hypothetical protein
MKSGVLVGRGGRILTMPEESWREGVAAAGPRIAERLEFMTAEHHAVRDLVVREMSRGLPLTARTIGEALGMATPRVDALLDELHRRLFFLVRNDDGEVRWAFPVTADVTPHRLDLGGGERVFAA